MNIYLKSDVGIVEVLVGYIHHIDLNIIILDWTSRLIDYW